VLKNHSQVLKKSVELRNRCINVATYLPSHVLFLWTEEDTLKTGFKVLHHMMSQNFNIKKYILLKKKGYINFEVQKDQNLSWQALWNSSQCSSYVINA